MSAPTGNQFAAKAKRWTMAIEQAMSKMDESRVDGWTTMQKLAEALVTEAMTGDMTALKEIGDRLEGKPAQGVTISGDEQNPLVLLMQQITRSAILPAIDPPDGD